MERWVNMEILLKTTGYTRTIRKVVNKVINDLAVKSLISKGATNIEHKDNARIRNEKI